LRQTKVFACLDEAELDQVGPSTEVGEAVSA
jgi:hypothetical protein